MKMPISTLTAFFLFIWMFGLPVYACPPGTRCATEFLSPTPTPTLEETLSQFRTVSRIQALSTPIPKVVQIPIAEMSANRYLILDVSTRKPQPFTIIKDSPKTSFRVKTSSTSDSLKLHDGDATTSEEFEVTASNTMETNTTSIQLEIIYSRPITTSSFQFSLDPNVMMPRYISIETPSQGGSRYLVRNQSVYQNTISFPRVYTDVFTVTFTFSQPLRINELSFTEDFSQKSDYFLRFLAYGGKNYDLYTNPDGYVNVPDLPESGYLDGYGVSPVKIDHLQSEQNPLYKEPDSDRDSIQDSLDNCLSVSNADQADIDGSGRGDACEDFDHDGVMNSVDNCPDNPNRSQQDTDADTIGDHCDSEESRFTERYAFLPWLGIGVGFAVVLLLFKMSVFERDNKQ